MRPARLRSAPIVVGVIAFALFCVGLTVPPWVFPPIESIETGPAAIEMVQFKDPDRVLPYSAKPEPLEAPDNEGSPKATEVYQNVQVLTDVTDAEFTRLMLAMTEWVAPKQGCEYCHNLESEQGFADDSLYTKKVARRMLQMVRYINSKWPEHVAPSGVTCYTCHRGQNVPPWTWYRQEKPSGDQFLGKPRPWHLEAKTIRQFFPDVPYNDYLLAKHKSAQIQSTDPLVNRYGQAEVAKEQDAEDLYLFMMQMAQSMGVNCTYCHNSRAFRDWSQSTPYRWIAYWGIRMARDLNSNYIEPMASVFPANRKGPLGDPAKIACGTCHEGNNKPLGGYRLLDHYLAGLTEDGKAPDPAPKQAILLGQAMPVATTGPDQDAAQPAPSPAPVSKEAIGESVVPQGQNGQQGQSGQQGVAAPSGSGTQQPAGSGSGSNGGADYKSQTKPGQPVGDETLGGTVTPIPQDQNTAPGATEPTGTAAPMNSAPDQMAPDSPMLPSGEKGTNDAPDTGQPPSNPLPADEVPGQEDARGAGEVAELLRPRRRRRHRTMQPRLRDRRAGSLSRTRARPRARRRASTEAGERRRGIRRLCMNIKGSGSRRAPAPFRMRPRQDAAAGGLPDSGGIQAYDLNGRKRPRSRVFHPACGIPPISSVSVAPAAPLARPVALCFVVMAGEDGVDGPPGRRGRRTPACAIGPCRTARGRLTIACGPPRDPPVEEGPRPSLPPAVAQADGAGPSPLRQAGTAAPGGLRHLHGRRLDPVVAALLASHARRCAR